jgi:AraC-like DNA-binding protein
MSALPSRSAEMPGFGIHISASAQHRVRTITIRDDLLVWVKRGRKTMLGAQADLAAGKGQALLVARGTQWDVINDPAGEPRYEALVLAFGDGLVREHLARVPAEPATHPVAAARTIEVDEELAEAATRAGSFLQARAVSAAVRRHRLHEVLLLLAERGHRFTPIEQLGWDERVRRLVAQRPDADWSVETLAAAFHASPSTLRRRLEGSGVTLAALVREVRMETALTLLQSTRLPIGEIAQRCGWESHSRFSAAFQERWGFAPSVLRAGLAQGAQRLTQPG